MDELLQEMIAPAPSRSDKARRRRLASTFAIVALAIVGITALTTSALFTDNEAIVGGAITTGTVNLTTSGALDFGIAAENLAPGDAAFATVDVTNSGSLAYRYAVQYQATDVPVPPATTTTASLSSQLTLTSYVLGGGGVVTCDRAGTDTATPLATVGPALATADLTKFIGDATQGAQAGDQTLPATGVQTLCFRIDLPIATSNAFQGTSTKITLRFDAEQTANN